MQVARAIGSSPSRPGKMESGDAPVSLDLLSRFVIASQAPPRAISPATAKAGSYQRDLSRLESRPDDKPPKPVPPGRANELLRTRCRSITSFGTAKLCRSTGFAGGDILIHDVGASTQSL